MTDLEIQIAVAKACGYSVSRISLDDADFPWRQYRNGKPNGPYWETEAGAWSHNVPAYHLSHDAMAEALGTMTELEWGHYITQLYGLVDCLNKAYPTVHDLLKATPRQQAVAFLKAKNLYTQ